MVLLPTCVTSYGRSLFRPYSASRSDRSLHRCPGLAEWFAGRVQSGQPILDNSTFSFGLSDSPLQPHFGLIGLCLQPQQVHRFSLRCTRELLRLRWMGAAYRRQDCVMACRTHARLWLKFVCGFALEVLCIYATCSTAAVGNSLECKHHLRHLSPL